MLISRRSLFESMASAGAMRSLGVLTASMTVPRSQAQVTPGIATFSPEIEPIVALIEGVSKDKAAEVVVAQLRAGVSYKELMAALFLAAIRNINPRPPGFALHSVFVIHAAHVIGLQSPPNSRPLPLFYALDVFKTAQERDARSSTGDYVMRSIDQTNISAAKALPEFLSSMESWDSSRAERAVTSVARHRSATEAFEIMWRYGVRDYRNIGHKAIFVANAERTLRTIGWQHSEPVLRSLVLGLLDFGLEQEVNGYAFADQCYSSNVDQVSKILPRMAADWSAKPADPAVTRTILKEIRPLRPSKHVPLWANALPRAPWVRRRSGMRFILLAVSCVCAYREALPSSACMRSRLAMVYITPTFQQVIRRYAYLSCYSLLAGWVSFELGRKLVRTTCDPYQLRTSSPVRLR